MTQCLAFDENGNRCINPPANGSDYCYHHLGRYEQAPLRAVILSIIMLAVIFLARFFVPELEDFASCVAVLAAFVTGLGVVLTKVNKRVR